MAQTLSQKSSDTEQYRRLWTVIIARAKKMGVGEKKIIPSQAGAAAELSVDPAAVSRVLNGTDLPQSHGLLVRIAGFFNASRSEKRALLALANAIVAVADNDEELADLYRQSFAPLFEEKAFAAEINTPQNVTFHSLIELGIPRNVALDIANMIEESDDEDKMTGKTLKALATSRDPACIDAMHRAMALFEIGKVFQEIVAIDFGVPWSGVLTRVVKHQMSNQSGVSVAEAWTRIPNVMITSLDLLPNCSVSDGKHSGFEFILLASGSGRFEMAGVGDVPMTSHRQVIAYRPTHVHRFWAGPEGAKLFVVSYLRPQQGAHDPIDELIRAAQRNGGAPTSRNKVRIPATNRRRKEVK